jgi:hypothetical protein
MSILVNLSPGVMQNQRFSNVVKKENNLPCKGALVD